MKILFQRKEAYLLGGSLLLCVFFVIAFNSLLRYEREIKQEAEKLDSQLVYQTKTMEVIEMVFSKISLPSQTIGNNEAIRNYLHQLAIKYYFQNIRINFSSYSKIYDHHLRKKNVEIYFSCLIDDHFWDFLKEIQKTFPYPFVIIFLSLEHPYTKKGIPSFILRGNLVLEWLEFDKNEKKVNKT